MNHFAKSMGSVGILLIGIAAIIFACKSRPDSSTTASSPLQQEALTLLNRIIPTAYAQQEMANSSPVKWSCFQHDPWGKESALGSYARLAEWLNEARCQPYSLVFSHDHNGWSSACCFAR